MIWISLADFWFNLRTTPQVDTFMHAAPSMFPLGGGRWLLHVHVMLHFRWGGEGR